MSKRKPNNSEFDKWFEDQHGKRPTYFGKTDFEILDMIRNGKNADVVHRSQSEYDARRESALYAWNAARGTNNK